MANGVAQPGSAVWKWLMMNNTKSTNNKQLMQRQRTCQLFHVICQNLPPLRTPFFSLLFCSAPPFHFFPIIYLSIMCPIDGLRRWGHSRDSPTAKCKREGTHGPNLSGLSLMKLAYKTLEIRLKATRWPLFTLLWAAGQKLVGHLHTGNSDPLTHWENWKPWWPVCSWTSLTEHENNCIQTNWMVFTDDFMPLKITVYFYPEPLNVQKIKNHMPQRRWKKIIYIYIQFTCKQYLKCGRSDWTYVTINI